MNENDISYEIRGAIFNVYNGLGPGLLESVYETVLAYELSEKGFKVERQVPIPVFYNGVEMEVGFRADIVVNGKVIIEIKSVEEIQKVHHKQLLTYLRMAECKLGILVNFNTNDITNSIFRKVNNL